MNREDAETYLLAGVGLAEGVWANYVRPELTAKRAWLAIGLGVTAYELACPKGETLSEGVDKALERSKLWALPIGYTALHLANLLPKQIDLFHQFTRISK